MIFQVLPSQISQVSWNAETNSESNPAQGADSVFLDLLNKLSKQQPEPEKPSRCGDDTVSALLIGLVGSFIKNAVTAEDDRTAETDGIKEVESREPVMLNSMMPYSVETIVLPDSRNAQELSASKTTVVSAEPNAETIILPNSGSVSDNWLVLPLQHQNPENMTVDSAPKGDGLSVNTVAVSIKSDAGANDMSAEQFVQAVTDAILRYAASMNHNGLLSDDKLIFSLSPEIPGNMAVEIFQKGNGFAVNITADTGGAFQVAESNLYRLIQALQRRNVDTSQLTVTLSMVGDGKKDQRMKQIPQMAASQDDDLSMLQPLTREEVRASSKSSLTNADGSQGPYGTDKESHVVAESNLNIAFADKIEGVLKQQSSIPLKELHVSNIATDLADEVQRFVAEHRDTLSDGKLVFQLQPENMGRIVIEMRYAGNQLNAHITADTSLAYQLIDSNLAQLQQALQHSGFNASQLVLTLGQSMQQWSRSGGGQDSYLYRDRRYVRDGVVIETLLPYDDVRAMWDMEDGQNMINQYA